MEKSKVIELLKCMKTNEISDFRKMLVSPYFTRKEVVKTLFEYLIKFHPNFEDSKKLDKALVYKKVFNEKIPKDESLIIKKLKNSSYDLKNLLEEFFILQELKEDRVGSNHYLLNRFVKSNQKQLIEKQIIATSKKIDGLKKCDNYYYQKFKLEQKRYTHSNKQIREDNRENELIYNLTSFFNIVILKYGINFRALKKLLGTNSLADFEETLEWSKKKSENSEEPIIRLYYLIVTFYKNNSTIVFDEVINQFRTAQSNLSQLESLNLLIALINITNQRFMNGEVIYSLHMFSLYQLGVEKKIFIQNNNMANYFFKYIVMAGCGVKNFEWLDSFMKENKKYLKESEKQDTLNYCEMMISFHNNDFQSALDKSLDVEFSNVFDKIALKNIVMRCYFELNEYSLFDYYKDSYKKFLHTNRQIGDERKERGLNFIRMIDNMMKDKNSSSQNLKKLFDELSPMDCRKWVYDKLF